MEKYSFFNDVDGDRVYFAEDFARHLAKYFTNGIFNNGCQVLADNDDMTVNVSIGSANINGYRYDNDSIRTLAIENADGILNRIDNIVIRWDLSNRTITSQVIKGTFAEEPVAPDLVRTSTMYDLRIAKINVPAGTTEITQDLVVDTRFSSDCGNVTQAVLSLDTDDIFAQYDKLFHNWFSELQAELDDDVAGNLQDEIYNLRIALGIETDTFNTSEIYNTGDLIVKNHTIYECNEDNVTGEWDISKWAIVPIIEDGEE